MKLPQDEMEIILNGISDFILIISPDMEIMEVNEAFLRHMNVSRDKVIGRKCYKVFKEDIKKNSNCDRVCPLKKVIHEKRPYSTTLTRIGGDNLPRYTELTIFPIWEKKGTILKFIEISRDITKRKRDEQEMTRRLEQMVSDRTRQLKETHEKLLHQDKMASLGKLASSVVHEINNPIAGILNLTMLCKRIVNEGEVGKDDFDDFLKYLNLMETEIRRISGIVANMLVFSRQSKVEFKKMNINELIEQMLILNSNLLKISGVKVKTSLSNDLPDLLGSADQLQQVFMNLVSNAAESMSVTRGGVLTVTSQYSAMDDAIVIRFKDTGTGIPRENFPKLFEPFYTTKKKGKGVGLGLSVAYGIIKDHGGTIYVDSIMGDGATFKITLPLKPKARK